MVGWGRGLVVNRNKGCQIFNMKKFLKLQKKKNLFIKLVLCFVTILFRHLNHKKNFLSISFIKIFLNYYSTIKK